ncbi:MAG TPA: RNA polymerase sigma factor [Streptosporangiaceae bacterium]
MLTGPRPRAACDAGDDVRDIEMSVRDPDRFGAIFDRYFGEIHRYVARRLGDEAADDIAAETFLTAFGKRHRFDASRGIVRAWLFGIATNHMSHYRRRELRKYRAMQRAGAALPGEGPGDPVADLVTAGAIHRRLAGALAKLSHGDREVLLLIALGGLSHAEVAAALGIPYGTVASRLSRARRKLRAELTAEAATSGQEDEDDG